MDGRYASVLAFIVTVEKNLFFWAIAITFFFSLSVVAVISKGRRWYELVALFFIVYLSSIVFAGAIFEYMVGLPFARLEMVSMP